MTRIGNTGIVKAGFAPCLVTVTTASYIQWTMTMLFSFHQSNPWYEGEFIVICNDLSDEDQRRFDIFQRVRFVTPSEELVARVKELTRVIPGFSRLAPMFYSLEIFNLTGYTKVLFLDSDMLVVKSLQSVFDFPEPFGACAESCWYMGKGRRTDTYDPVDNCPDSGLFLENPINSGFMILDGSFIHTKNYEGLIKLIEPALWANKNTLHADQLIINLFFRDRIKRLDASYNYRPTNATEILARDGVQLEDAKIIHYFRQYKPWNFDQVLALSQHDMVHIKAFQLWYICYVGLLKCVHLRNKLLLLKHNEKTLS
jgi:lipopolysaccharide biosynthesis glycosyltransferase